MRKKIVPTTAIVLVTLAIIFHFIPIYSRTGYLAGKDMANVCIAYSAPVDHTYHAVINGIGGFSQDKSQFSTSNAGCSEWVTLQLYLL